MRLLFWTATALLAWTQALYAPALYALRRLKGGPPVAPEGEMETATAFDGGRLQGPHGNSGNEVSRRSMSRGALAFATARNGQGEFSSAETSTGAAGCPGTMPEAPARVMRRWSGLKGK